MNNSIIIECTLRYIIYYNDRQETTLSFFSFLYFISIFEMLPYGINTYILMREIFPKVLPNLF